MMSLTPRSVRNSVTIFCAAVTSAGSRVAPVWRATLAARLNTASKVAVGRRRGVASRRRCEPQGQPARPRRSGSPRWRRRRGTSDFAPHLICEGFHVEIVTAAASPTGTRLLPERLVHGDGFRRADERRLRLLGAFVLKREPDSLGLRGHFQRL